MEPQEYTDQTRMQDYVTHPSLSNAEATTPDDHGVYPINPLGLPYSDSCAVSETCERVNPDFPMEKHFTVETIGDDIPEYILISAPLMKREGLVASLIVKKVETVDTSGHRYRTRVPGNILALLESTENTFAFDNASYENYDVTGLLSGDIVAVTDEFPYYDAENNETVITFVCNESKVTGTIGERRLVLTVDLEDDSYVLLTDQEDETANGLYAVLDGTWPRIASVGHVLGEKIRCEHDEETGEVVFSNDELDPYNHLSAIDNVPECNHFRHGYSDREVADIVSDRCYNIIENAKHPMSTAGDLSGAGLLTKWFVECGRIDLGASHNSGRHVAVEGFGLGGYLTGDCTYGNMCPREHTKHESGDGIPVTSPVIRFGIGAGMSDDAFQRPDDWPFTEHSEHIGPRVDNNITLLKKLTKVANSSDMVGGLYCDVYEDCKTCGGTGVIDDGYGEEIECPTCHGEGRILVAHRKSDRVEICVTNDFANVPDDGVSVMKKTYVHLPAPIDTKDGDEFEVTVSIPTLNVEEAFPETADDSYKKNLSAYYEYVSEPRVLVMSGYWKFSDTNVTWVVDNSNNPYYTKKITIAGDDVWGFKDKDGELVPTGIKIRFTLDGGNNCPRYSDMVGLLSVNETGLIEITDLEGYNYGKRLRDNHLRICGIGYLDPISVERDECDNCTEMPMGLHSRNATTLGSAAGTGEGISKYNKFIYPTKEKNDRQCVTVDSDGNKADSRQVIATVYPTTTNTFPWAIIGRHKMKHLDELMTDEWDLGEHSVSSMIWRANKDILDIPETNSFFGYGLSNYALPSYTMPLRYGRDNCGSGKSRIGSQLRITLPKSGEVSDDVSTQPIRQARKAAKMLADDFKKLRMYRGSDFPSLERSSHMRYVDTGIDGSLVDTVTTWKSGSTAPSQDVLNNEYSTSAWMIKARHLPDYIRKSGQVPTINGNSVIGINPFIDNFTSGRYSQNLYHTTEFGSNSADSEVPCDEMLYGENVAFGYRSIVAARVEADQMAVNNDLFRDANRVAELQRVSVDKWFDGSTYDFNKPYKYLLNGTETEKWQDIYSAVSNVFSIDTVPFPDNVEIDANVSFTDAELPMISGDPFATYILSATDDWAYLSKLKFVSNNLPFYDTETPRSMALTKLLRNLVSPYSGKLPVRWWDGTRISVAEDGIHGRGSKIIQLTRLQWPEDECEGGLTPSVRASKVDDEFMLLAPESDAVDCNLNTSFMTEGNQKVFIHTNWSAPLIKVRRDWYNRAPFVTNDTRFQGPSGYIRVFMKFRFSVQAGRWYTIDYRQAPMSYLSPLYGAKALEEKIEGHYIWTESMCSPFGDWQETLMHPYFKYTAMDINPAVVPYLVENKPDDELIDTENNTDLATSTVRLPRLEKPYLSIADGGLGLSAPADVNGNPASVDTGVHANFWSIRRHLRPAVSALAVADIPGTGYADIDTKVMDRTGGIMGDSVLWGQFSFPNKGIVEYNVPTPNPYDDKTGIVLGKDENILGVKEEAKSKVLGVGEIDNS